MNVGFRLGQLQPVLLQFLGRRGLLGHEFRQRFVVPAQLIAAGLRLLQIGGGLGQLARVAARLGHGQRFFLGREIGACLRQVRLHLGIIQREKHLPPLHLLPLDRIDALYKCRVTRAKRTRRDRFYFSIGGHDRTQIFARHIRHGHARRGSSAAQKHQQRRQHERGDHKYPQSSAERRRHSVLALPAWTGGIKTWHSNKVSWRQTNGRRRLAWLRLRPLGCGPFVRDAAGRKHTHSMVLRCPPVC